MSAQHDICFELKDHDPRRITKLSDLGSASYIGWMLSAVATAIACAVSLFLITKHLHFYTKPNQQRYIIRIILLIPIYAITSWLSYFYFREAVYIELIRDCYEAFVIASFFILLLQYLGDSTQAQTEKIRDSDRKSMALAFPFCCIHYNPCNPHFLWVLKYCILQYVVLRPVLTVTAVILQHFGVYCPESLSPKYSHLYIVAVMFLSVSVALYALVTIYVTLKDDLKEYNPLSKFIAIKLIVFIVFWQYVAILIAAHFGLIKETEYWTTGNISSGLNAFIICFEMIIFAVYFHRAFEYRPYRPVDRTHTPQVWRGMVDSLNPMDFIREIWYGILYLKYIISRKHGKNLKPAGSLRRNGTIVRRVDADAETDLPPEQEGRGTMDIESVMDRVRHGSVRRYHRASARMSRSDAYTDLEAGEEGDYRNKPLPEITDSNGTTFAEPSLDADASMMYQKYWQQTLVPVPEAQLEEAMPSADCDITMQTDIQHSGSGQEAIIAADSGTANAFAHPPNIHHVSETYVPGTSAQPDVGAATIPDMPETAVQSGTSAATESSVSPLDFASMPSFFVTQSSADTPAGPFSSAPNTPTAAMILGASADPDPALNLRQRTESAGGSRPSLDMSFVSTMAAKMGEKVKVGSKHLNEHRPVVVKGKHSSESSSGSDSEARTGIGKKHRFGLDRKK